MLILSSSYYSVLPSAKEIDLTETLKPRPIDQGGFFMEKRRIVRGIILAMLLISTALVIISIVQDPLGNHNLLFPLAITAGFSALDADSKKAS